MHECSILYNLFASFTCKHYKDPSGLQKTITHCKGWFSQRTNAETTTRERAPILRENSPTQEHEVKQVRGSKPFLFGALARALAMPRHFLVKTEHEVSARNILRTVLINRSRHSFQVALPGLNCKRKQYGEGRSKWFPCLFLWFVFMHARNLRLP